MGFIEEQQLESAYVMGTYARKPVELVRGRGMRVEDAEGAQAHAKYRLAYGHGRFGQLALGL